MSSNRRQYGVRIATRLVIYSTAGLVGALLIATIVAAFTMVPGLKVDGDYQHPEHDWRWARSSGFGVQMIEVDATPWSQVFQSGSIPYLGRLFRHGHLIGGRVLQPPAWSLASRIRIQPSVSGEPVWFWREVAVGWPFVFLSHAEFRNARTGQFELRGALIVPVPTSVLGRCVSRSVAFPRRVKWLGLIGSSVFWAVLLYVATGLPFVLRRAIRQYRRFCLICGYDLRGNLPQGCPECGWRREEAS